MTLGTGCLLLPLHHPVEIAEQLATLDVITGGRFIFGVGLGYRDVENEAMGHDPKERVGRLVEGLEVIERLWNGEPVTYQGTHFRLRDVRISMRPLQRPRPPIWLAANSDAGVRRAARLGDAWLMNPPRHAPDARAPGRSLQAHPHRARPPDGDRDAAHQGVLRRAGVVRGIRRGRSVPRRDVPRLPPVGAGQGAARRGELPGELRGAGARPVRPRRPREGRRGDRPLSRAARRHDADFPDPVAGHGPGAGPPLDPPPRHEGAAQGHAIALTSRAPSRAPTIRPRPSGTRPPWRRRRGSPRTRAPGRRRAPN